MLGLIRSKDEDERQRGFLSRAAPDVCPRKMAVYEDGFLAYTLTALTPKERKAMRSAGYEYYGGCWYRKARPKLRVVQ